MRILAPALCLIALLTCTGASQDDVLVLRGNLNDIPAAELQQATAEYSHVVIASTSVRDDGAISLISPTAGFRMKLDGMSAMLRQMLLLNGREFTPHGQVAFVDTPALARLRPRPVDAADLAAADANEVVWFCMVPSDPAAAQTCARAWGDRVGAVVHGAMLELSGKAGPVREVAAAVSTLEAARDVHARAFKPPEGVQAHQAASVLAQLFHVHPRGLRWRVAGSHIVAVGTAADLANFARAIDALRP